ncbi:hypothetical protein [Micromonospora sp. NBS 11-29]|nr:hypothetical protein [Micromonospora sp. NBS 11-29]
MAPVARLVVAGKIERFDCYNAANVLLAQIDAGPDFNAAIEAARPACRTV